MGCISGKVEPGPERVRDDLAAADQAVLEEWVRRTSRPSLDMHKGDLDPRSPLSLRHCFKLKASWKAIRRHMDDTGIEMFLRLFKDNADLMELFQNFKHLKSEDELRSNEELENHAMLVMTTLDDAITHIDNFHHVSEVLCKTGLAHVKIKGFHSQNFFKIREPFLEAVKITLGDRYTENIESIYKVAISFILQTMCDGMAEACKSQPASGADPVASPTTDSATKTMNSDAAPSPSSCPKLPSDEENDNPTSMPESNDAAASSSSCPKLPSDEENGNPTSLPESNDATASSISCPKLPHDVENANPTSMPDSNEATASSSSCPKFPSDEENTNPTSLPDSNDATASSISCPKLPHDVENANPTSMPDSTHVVDGFAQPPAEASEILTKIESSGMNGKTGVVPALIAD